MTKNVKRLNGLKATEYEHPLDREALKKLEAIPAMSSLTKKLIKMSYEKVARIQTAGSHLQVTRKNLPHIHDLLAEACATLDIHLIPDLYLQWDYSINAATMGVENPFIVINSGCIDILTDNELLFILGHELGHIKSQHVLYRTLANIFPILAEQASQYTLGIAGFAGKGVEFALMNWYRMSEFTADRAGLLACQDSKACISCFQKLAGMPKKYECPEMEQTFLEQARTFQDYDYDSVSHAIKLLSTLTMTHPWAVMRAAEFNRWIDSGEYAKIVDGELRILADVNIGDSYCSNCGSKLSPFDRFCGGCGASVSA